jgi:hypothetical protein
MGLITHHRTTEGIHELVFQKASRASIEELSNLLDNMYQTNAESSYCLLDLRTSGMLPIRYLTYQMRRLHAAYPKHHPIHIALVLDDKVMLNMSEILLRTVMQRDRAQYFTRIEKAQEWLRLEQKKALS